VSEVRNPSWLNAVQELRQIDLPIALSGGQLTIMVTDCLEGLISGGFYVVIAAAVMFLFTWAQYRETMLSGAPGPSLISPFDTQARPDLKSGMS